MQLLRATIGSSLEEQYRQHWQTFRRLVVELDETVQAIPDVDLQIDPNLKIKSLKNQPIVSVSPANRSEASGPVRELVSMGFDHRQAECALSLAENNLVNIYIFYSMSDILTLSGYGHRHTVGATASCSKGTRQLRRTPPC